MSVHELSAMTGDRFSFSDTSEKEAPATGELRSHHVKLTFDKKEAHGWFRRLFSSHSYEKIEIHGRAHHFTKCHVNKVASNYLRQLKNTKEYKDAALAFPELSEKDLIRVSKMGLSAVPKGKVRELGELRMGLIKISHLLPDYTNRFNEMSDFDPTKKFLEHEIKKLKSLNNKLTEMLGILQNPSERDSKASRYNALSSEAQETLVMLRAPVNEKSIKQDLAVLKAIKPISLSITKSMLNLMSSINYRQIMSLVHAPQKTREQSRLMSKRKKINSQLAQMLAKSSGISLENLHEHPFFQAFSKFTVREEAVKGDPDAKVNLEKINQSLMKAIRGLTKDEKEVLVSLIKIDQELTAIG